MKRRVERVGLYDAGDVLSRLQVLARDGAKFSIRCEGQSVAQVIEFDNDNQRCRYHDGRGYQGTVRLFEVCVPIAYETAKRTIKAA